MASDLRFALTLRVALAAALVAVAAALVARTSFAQPSDADRGVALRLMRDGDALFRAGDFPAALNAYQSADRIVNALTTRVAVARAEEALGHLIEARSLVQDITREGGPEDPEPFVTARQEAQGILARVQRKVASLVVVVEGGAGTTPKLEVDGTALAPEQVGTPRGVNPGKHTVRGTAEGYSDSVAQVDLADGESRTVRVVLAPMRGEGATVRDNPETSTETSPSPFVWGGFGVGALGIGIGGVTGAMAFSRANAARAQCTGNICPSSAQADINATHSLGTVSTVAFIAAAVGVGVGTYGLFRSARAPSGAIRLHPWLALDGMGVRGAF